MNLPNTVAVFFISVAAMLGVIELLSLFGVSA